MAQRLSPQWATRGPAEWALRGGLAALALLLGYASTTHTLAVAITRSDAERAHALAPGDGQLAGGLAKQIAASDVDAGQRARADRLAHQALIDEPLAVPALTALALQAQLRGDTTRARTLFERSDRVSRRELGTRLWFIEDAVARGDVTGALRHYDIALRTSRAAAELLFPVMAQALADPAVSDALVARLAARPAWAEGFVTSVNALGTPPVVAAAFFRRLAAAGVPVADGAQVQVIDALVAAGSYDDGWRYYVSLRGPVDRRHSRDPDFTQPPRVASVFDWTPRMDEAGISALIDTGVFDFAATPTVGGVILQQTQLLAPGVYRLTGSSSGIDQPPDTRPYWQLACLDGRELGRVELSNSSVQNGRFAGLFTVGRDCAAQSLRLVLRPSLAASGVSGQFDRVELASAGGRQ